MIHFVTLFVNVCKVVRFAQNISGVVFRLNGLRASCSVSFSGVLLLRRSPRVSHPINHQLKSTVPI